MLPGGLVDPDETAREPCVREVREGIGVRVRATRFVGLYDDPDRDDRGSVSAAYLCDPVDGSTPEPRGEARRVTTVDPDDLPPMGFDHGRIAAAAALRRG